MYVYNKEASQRCQQAIAQWKASDDIIPVAGYSFNWTYESARLFVRALSQLFQEYNRVLWQSVHYCRQCGGQCCVVDASDVRPFDLMAVALLDLLAPSLPDQITAGGRACIYLSNHRCSWPQEWRTIKCWSFYCLGVGPWKPGASIGQLRGAIIDELQRVVRACLPDQLREYEAVHGVALADYLDDPVGFSDALHNAIGEIFVRPFNTFYSISDINEAGSRNGSHIQKDAALSLLLDDEVSAFIAEAAEQLCEYPPAVPEGLEVSAERFLADLELLQWIIEGRPSDGPKLLEEMYRRYANASAPREGEAPTIWYRMREQCLKMVAFY